MPNQPVPNTIQANVRYLLFGQLVENVYHIESPNGVDAQVLSDVLAQMASWASLSLHPLLSQSLVFTGVVVTNLSIEGGGQLAFEQVGGLPGGDVQVSEPGNVSYCISLRTARIGRAYRGRKYIAGMPIDKRTGNTVNAGWAGALVQSFQDLVAVLQTINCFLVVVSRTLDLVERLVPVTETVVSITTTDLFIDSQRRRLTGRGQ